MKFGRALILINIITFLILCYVHQQVELVKLSYDILGNERKSLYLLDQRENLVYNLNNLAAPKRLEGELIAHGAKFSQPAQGQVIKVVRIQRSQREGAIQVAGSSKYHIAQTIADLFGLRAEAQAKEK